MVCCRTWLVNVFQNFFQKRPFQVIADHLCFFGSLTGAGLHGQVATEAARGAADIVLTEPGLSTICSAVIGARKIFQRMTTYAKYTVAMTFRICFTFGILTVVYNWYLLHSLSEMPGCWQQGCVQLHTAARI